VTPEALLGVFLAEARRQSAWAWSTESAESLAATQLLLSASADVRGRVVLLAAEALAVPPEGSGRYDSAWSPALGFLVRTLLQHGAALDPDQLARLVNFAARWPAWDWLDTPPYDVVLDAVSAHLRGQPPGPDLAASLRDLRVRLAVEGAWDAPQQLRLRRLDDLIRPRMLDADALLDPSDRWAQGVEAAVVALDEGRSRAWRGLLAHASTARRSAPSTRWLEHAREHLDAVGPPVLHRALSVWLPAVPLGLTRAQAEERQTLRVTYRSADAESLPVGLGDANRHVVRGLVWTAGLVSEAPMLDLLQDFAVRCHARLPGVGAGDVLLGNAAVRALSLSRQGRARRQALLDAVESPRARRFIERVLGREGAE